MIDFNVIINEKTNGQITDTNGDPRFMVLQFLRQTKQS